MSAKLTLDDVREILAILEESSFDELRLETDELKISIRRNGAGSVVVDQGSPAAAPFGSNSAAQPPALVTAAAPTVHAGSAQSSLIDVVAPMLGIFYHAPKPGADNYVKVGDRVTSGAIIGIIEVMKLMNPVPAGIDGEVIEIIAPDAELVEYGQLLLRVRPD